MTFIITGSYLCSCSTVGCILYVSVIDITDLYALHNILLEK